MSWCKLLIVFIGLCRFSGAYQVSIPAATEKGEFLGCYMDSMMAKNQKIIEGTHRSTDCVEICHEKYFRYSLVRLDETCICSNFLGDIKSSKLCKEECPNCDMKEQISDVYNTAVQMNGPPRNFLVRNITDTQAVLTWEVPESYLTIESYKVMATVLKTYSHSSPSTFSWTNLYSNDTLKVNIITLHPGTSYNLTVQADSFNIEGAKTSQTFQTLIGEPDSSPRAPTILGKHDTTLMIKLEPGYNNNGPVTSYMIVVIEANAVQAVQSENLKSYGQANADGIPFYVTAELPPSAIDKPFTIGDSKSYGKYFNAPLLPDKNYHVMVGMTSRQDGREFVVYSDTAGLQVDVIMSHMPTSEAEESSVVIVLLSLAIVIISLLLVVGLIGFYFLRNRVQLNHRQRLNDNQELTIQGPMIDVENNGYIPEDELPQTSNHYKSLHERVWTIPRSALDIDQSQFLGYGKFGRIHPGTVLKNEQHLNITSYCINDKKLQPLLKRHMLKDLDLVIKTSGHPNVFDLIGTCDRPDMVAVVFEHSALNLKEYLLNNRILTAQTFTTIKESQAVDFAFSIAKGMEHLHALKIIHKQLCATHIAIVGNQAKVAGFGLAKFYRSEQTPNFLRHTAREVLRGMEPTYKSDVWAFAVLLWEISSLGGTPYAHLTQQELPDKIIQENLSLQQLPYLYDTFYQVMLNCWQIDWDERPTFAELAEHIDFIRNEECLNFRTYPGFQYEVFNKDLEFSDAEIF